MSRKQKLARSGAAEKKAPVGDGPYRESEPREPMKLPEIVPAVTLIREGPEGYRVVLMHLPYDVVVDNSTHLFEPDCREVTEAQILGIFQRWREDGVIT